MRRKTRGKVKKGIIIAGIVIGIILIIVGIFLIVKLSKGPEISYDDGVVCKNYFSEMTIDLDNKEVKRDNTETSLQEEFNITKEQEELCFSSKEEMNNFLSNSVFETSVDGQKFTIKNPYQTKKIIVKSNDVKEKVDGEEIEKISEGIYVLSFYSEKLTKAMYNYYKDQDYIEEIFNDEIFIDEPINDISQTMYGNTEIDIGEHHSLGVTTMGLDRYAKIINDNGNPKEIVISTVGYGIDYENEFFNDKLDENYYNFILNNKDISETIEQGSRIAEVLVDSTTPNVKIMPLVTVTEEGYTSISSIVQALGYGIKNSDVICYELINKSNPAINMVLENAFKENVPVCSVTSKDRENYPANHEMTIATSSIDRDSNIADYSGTGEFIDFAAPSTDIKEIFSKRATISRWSGAQYSNAQIVAAIALIKTYNKEATILDVYNFLRNFSVDLGDEGKDEIYGYGCPSFRDLKISDIDKTIPNISKIEYDNENWEVLKQVEISASDNIRVNAWAITQNESSPNNKEWKVLESVTPDLNVTPTVTENGKYHIWVQDTAGNTVTQEITIEKIDKTPPQIAYTINKDTLSSGYVTINVTAEDTESGMGDNPFSWDKRTWSLENSTKTFKENGRYKIYVKDKLDNIAEQEIIVDCFPQEGTASLGDGNIITSIKVSKDWSGNTNNNVEITLNKELDIVGWKITNDLNIPRDYIMVESERGTIPTSTSRSPNTRINATTNTSTNSSTNINTSNRANTNSNTNSSNRTNNTSTNVSTNTSTNTVSNTTNSISNNINGTNTTQTPVVPPRTEPIVIKTTLDINKVYYLWVKDRSGGISCQTFSISKAQI